MELYYEKECEELEVSGDVFGTEVTLSVPAELEIVLCNDSLNIVVNGITLGHLPIDDELLYKYLEHKYS